MVSTVALLATAADPSECFNLIQWAKCAPQRVFLHSKEQRRGRGECVGMCCTYTHGASMRPTRTQHTHNTRTTHAHTLAHTHSHSPPLFFLPPPSPLQKGLSRGAAPIRAGDGRISAARCTASMRRRARLAGGSRCGCNSPRSASTRSPRWQTLSSRLLLTNTTLSL